MFMNNIKKYFVLCMLATSMLFIQGCTAYDTPVSIAEDVDDSGVQSVSRKVLWINIDGAVSEIVKSNIPSGGTLEKMLQHSKVLWTGLSEERILLHEDQEDPITWTSMLTGVQAVKHRVTDDSYMMEPVTDVNGNKVYTFPNIFAQITTQDAKKKSLAVTPHKDLNERFMNNASLTITTANDEETASALVERLAHDDFSLVVAAFTGMLDAGRNGGFSAENPNYVGALDKIDAYIGTVLDCIKARENYYYEDWLVIVSSNHGGTMDGHYNGTSDEERNIFGIFYYPHYKGEELKGELIPAMYFDKDGLPDQLATVIDSCEERYSLRPERQLSIELLKGWEPGVPCTRYAIFYNTHTNFLSKGQWQLRCQTQTHQFGVFDGGNEGINPSTRYHEDPFFHTYSISVNVTGNRSVSLLAAIDGGAKEVYEWTKSVTVLEHDSTNLVITPGYNRTSKPYAGSSMYVAELRIWEKTSTLAEFNESADVLDLQKNAPSLYNDRLIGYWRFTPEYIDAQNDTILHAAIEGCPDMHLSVPMHIKKRPNTFTKNLSASKIVMENTLIVPQIYYWFGFSIPTYNVSNSKESTLDSFLFLDRYLSEEDWRGGEDDEFMNN